MPNEFLKFLPDAASAAAGAPQSKSRTGRGGVTEAGSNTNYEKPRSASTTAADDRQAKSS
jgi:hypothetical protein